MFRNLGLVMLALMLVEDSRGETTSIPPSRDEAVLSLNVTANIVGGCLTAGAYPSFATSTTDILDLNMGRCGATLVARDMLVSTASCYQVFERSGYVYIGGTKRPGVGSDTPEIRSISQLHIHPQYDARNAFNDIMLIQLAEISSAPSALWNTNSDVPADGESLTVIGFGITETFVVSTGLKQALINVVSNQQCMDTFRSVRITDTLCRQG
jgi:secreted trypsin-like serine protease